MSDSLVADNPELSRVELTVDGDLAGILAYDVIGSTVILRHTVVKEQYGDHGWAAVLVRGALDILRMGDLRVWPACAMVRRVIGAEPEYLPLVADQDPEAEAAEADRVSEADRVAEADRVSVVAERSTTTGA